MKKITENLYQFSQYNSNANLTTNQYLMDVSEPYLVHAGDFHAAAQIIPEIEAQLNGRALSRIIVSHLGADECGGLSAITARWPEAQVICSAHVAKELPGFGIKANLVTASSGTVISGSDFALRFIDYPCEAHLLPGILSYDEKSGVFFSSDLMLRMGSAAGEIVMSEWKDEVQATGLRQVPNRIMLKTMRKELLAFKPRLVAVGHGFCLKIV